MDYSGQTTEDLRARVDAIERQIPGGIRAQVRPLERQLQQNRQVFESFRERVVSDMAASRRQHQRQIETHGRLIAEHNQIIRVMLNMLSQLQAPTAQRTTPRRTRTTDRRGPSRRPNQSRAPGNEDAESTITRQRILSDARFERDGRVYYRCGVCSKDYQKAEWFIRHIICHRIQAPGQ